MSQIKLLLVEDHHVVRAALVSFLSQEENITIVGELADTARLEETIKTSQPDVLLLDAHVPGRPILETIQILRERFPALRVVMLSAYRRREYVTGLIELGAAGYILKDDPQESLLQAVQVAARGQQWFSPRVMDVIIKGEKQSKASTLQNLTERELDVLRLLVKGYRNAEIASALTLTEQTIKNYLRRIYNKLGVSTRVEAVRQAMKQNLVPFDEQTLLNDDFPD
ncbi:MAG: response regulator transcription factor [Anaerolineales bacterium]|nr:response regulator transcription factor [Anaerolineales bacterium]